MKAWGLGLHNSDYDADLIRSLDAECGLFHLTREGQSKSGPQTNYSILARQQNDVDNRVAREVLLTTGALAKVTRETWDKPASVEDRFDLRYTLTHIGLCAMSHGIPLGEDFLEYMRENFTETEFQREALKQIDTVSLPRLLLVT